MCSLVPAVPDVLVKHTISHYSIKWHVSNKVVRHNNNQMNQYVNHESKHTLNGKWTWNELTGIQRVFIYQSQYITNECLHQCNGVKTTSTLNLIFVRF